MKKNSIGFKRHLYPHRKFWWKVTFPGAFVWALGTFFLVHRAVSWDFVFSWEFYLKFLIYLAFSSIGNYYLIYRPNLTQTKILQDPNKSHEKE